MATYLLIRWNEKSKRVYSNLVDLPLETDLEMLLLQGELMNKLIWYYQKTESFFLFFVRVWQGILINPTRDQLLENN